MAWVVILSEEEKKLFSFDEKCLYIDGQPCEKKLKGLPFYVYKYLVESYPSFLTCDQIFTRVWEEELRKDKPIDDASIRDKISIIRSYLGDTSEPYQYVQTADKAYRSTKNGTTCPNPQQFFSKQKEWSSLPEGSSGSGSPRSKRPKEPTMLVEDRRVLASVAHDVHLKVDVPKNEIIAMLETIINVWQQSEQDMWRSFDFDQKCQRISEDYFFFLEKSLSHSPNEKT